MCFSNLPVEFDEDGNPTLADEADEVEHVAAERDPVDLDDDPEAVYEALIAAVSEETRTRVAGEAGNPPAARPQEAGESPATGPQSPERDRP